MLTTEMEKILVAARKTGWVLEPEAKRLVAMIGIDVPRHRWARAEEEAVAAARVIGWPVVAKLVSPAAMHKSDVGGVVVGIPDEAALAAAWARFSAFERFEGMLVEEMVAGDVELIVGAKNDAQFGPVVLLGMGGVAVEIYRDTSIRMAPLREKDVSSMVEGLVARRLIEGYRGSPPVDMKALTRTMLLFSEFAMELAPWIDSIDLNPVMCAADRCVVADARIVLGGLQGGKERP
ncbi:MAG: acetate--CoA ligase family protein [Candidatus Krumholzibacteriota bacterium]|nr:acetate--CoA ligase family protein [Candidatus Krumholzibacteriota bacterium]